MNWQRAGPSLLGLIAILVLVGCSSTGTAADETTTTGPPLPATAATATTTAPTTTTTSEPTTTSTTVAATTTVGTIDRDTAQAEIAAAGDRWIAGHEVTLDQVQALNDVNLQVATGQDSLWVDIFGTDDGNIYALYTTLAICTWIEEQTGPQDVLDTVVVATADLVDDEDEVMLFTGLAVSGAANIVCPELSDAVRQVVPHN